MRCYVFIILTSTTAFVCNLCIFLKRLQTIAVLRKVGLFLPFFLINYKKGLKYLKNYKVEKIFAYVEL